MEEASGAHLGQKLYVVGDNRFHQISVAFLPENHQDALQDEAEDVKIQWSHENTPEDHHHEFLPVPWQPPLPVRNIACAAHWTGLVLQDGSLYEFGTLLGTPRPYPTKVAFPAGSQQPRVTQLCCGRRFALCLTEEANVYAWGYNGFGQLGNGAFEHSEKPALIQSLKPGPSTVKKIGAGANHAGAIVEVRRPEILEKPPRQNGPCHNVSMSVYTWGANRYAQCGPPACRHRPKPLKVMGIPNAPSTPVKFAAGKHHSTVLTDRGDIWTWGANSGGRLGRSGLQYPYTASPGKIVVDAHEGKQHFNDVSCGHFHTSALTSNGDVYCWGVSSEGQCGTLSQEKQGAALRLPRKMDVGEDQDITSKKRSISTGANHTFYLDNASIQGLWSWGDSFGGLGVLQENRVAADNFDGNGYFNPVKCTIRNGHSSEESLKENVNIELIAAGTGHSVLLCAIY
eukprot:gb/GECG01016326.1/.p1 GENE.gb/GECG01016326.1/~~gb/GECG01016326.1/.p1  ORF type:complete len:455 (+),score=32.94 gb/GECG01016326.1/:1-1365(+)